MSLTLIYLFSFLHFTLTGKEDEDDKEIEEIFIPVKYHRVCYFTNWGAHRSIKESRVYPEDIPADLCTHILYAFANLNGRSLQPQLANDIHVYQGEQVHSFLTENDYRLGIYFSHFIRVL